MKVFVTGSTGFLGRYTVRALLDAGHDVAALVRPSREIPEEFSQRGIEAVRGDLRRPGPEIREAAAGADAVLHLAVGVGGWRAAFEGTVLGTERLLDGLREAGWSGRFVTVSSFSVYGLNQIAPGSVVDETTPVEPAPERRDDYAWTKVIQEDLVRRFGEEGPASATIVRPGPIYGREASFPSRAGRRVANVVAVFGGSVPMPMVYVENVASLLVAAAENPAAGGEIFNAVDPDPPTQWRYVRRWAGAQARRPLMIPLPIFLLRGFGLAMVLLGRLTGGRVGPPMVLTPYVMDPQWRRWSYDVSKPARVLGWSPPVAPEEALRRTFD